MICNNKIILISGTPCTGKTSIADQLNNDLSKKYISKLIKMNDFALKNDLIESKDIDKGYNIINISKLNKKLNETINDFFIEEDSNINLINEDSSSHSDNNINNNVYSSKIVIIEGHLSHFCSLEEKVDKVIVLRLNPKYLEKRLKLRNYNDIKIHENLEAEALGVCSVEAYENHGNKVNEIDTTNISIENLLKIVKEIIFDKKEYPVGNIDYMNWILENS